MLPRTGVYTTRGVNMERQAVQPDVMVEATPDQRASGDDPQLASAVDVLKGDVLVWQQRLKGGGAQTAGAAPMTAGGAAPAAPGGSKP